MKHNILAIVVGSLLIAACGSKNQESAKKAPEAVPAAVPEQTAPSNPVSKAPPPVEVAPAKPPEPKKYTIAAGTPISVRTIDAVNTKHTQTENEFEGSLASALVVDGHTLAKSGATVIGAVTNADQGGRVKGKASLTLTVSRVLLASGRYLNLHTNTVTQVAASGTKKNLKRTGLLAGGGAVVGAIAGGGKGAAIGAAVGGGAGVATNLATRGPAAEIPAGTVLSFTTTQAATVTEQR